MAAWLFALLALFTTALVVIRTVAAKDVWAASWKLKAAVAVFCFLAMISSRGVVAMAFLSATTGWLLVAVGAWAQARTAS